MSKGNVGKNAASDMVADLVLSKILDYLAVHNPRLWDTLHELVNQNRFLTHGGLIVAAEGLASLKDELSFLPPWIHEVLDAGLEQSPMTIVNYFKQRPNRGPVASAYLRHAMDEPALQVYVQGQVRESPLTAFHRSAQKAIRRAAGGLADVLGSVNDSLAARRRRRMIAERKSWYRNAAIVVAIVLTVATHQGTSPLAGAVRAALDVLVLAAVGAIAWRVYAPYKAWAKKRVDEIISGRHD